MKAAIADRFSALILGLIIGVVMSTLFAAYGYYICLIPGGVDEESVVANHICAYAAGFYWELLIAPGLIGLIFGFDRMMKYLEPMFNIVNGKHELQRGRFNFRAGTARNKIKSDKKVFNVWGGSFFFRSQITITTSYIKIKKRTYTLSEIDSVVVSKDGRHEYDHIYYVDIVFKNHKKLTISSNGIKTVWPPPDDRFLSALDELLFEFRKNNIPVKHESG